MNSATAERPPTSDNRNWLAVALLSPLLWGGLLTVGFYALISHLPAKRELAQRYFCSHPLEYATTGLFFVALATLAVKAIRLSGERAALSNDLLLDEAHSRETSDPLQRAVAVQHRLTTLPSLLRRTQLAERVRDVCLYVRGQQSSRRLEDHLKYLADLAADRLHDSYALVRTITWAIPILGFLGTVVGITIAIANVTPEQLDTSLGDVTSGLAVAFDTTALALTLSLLLVFCSFLVERSEQGILARVEEYGIQRLAPLFPSGSGETSPLLKAEAEAARQLLTRTEALIDRQTQLWQDALESLRKRWTETLEDQKTEFDGAIRQGMAATLENHAAQLSQARREFLAALNDASQQLCETVSSNQQAQTDRQNDFAERLVQLWQHVESEMCARQGQYMDRAEHLCQSLVGGLSQWQAELQKSNDAASSQIEELKSGRETLLQIVSEEKELTRLQARLTDNLDAVRATETFEQTLHTLSAAVNLLAARAHIKAA